MDRRLLREVLCEASRELAEKNGRDVIFAAPLANLVQQKLRQRLANDGLELAGRAHGARVQLRVGFVGTGAERARPVVEATFVGEHGIAATAKLACLGVERAEL